MLVGRVIGDQIENHTDAARVRVREQPVEIGERAEERVDVAVIGDVVAEVFHWRGEERRDPDAGDAEPGEVVEALANAFEIAAAVAVRVAERARVDLIDRAVAPP